MTAERCCKATREFVFTNRQHRQQIVASSTANGCALRDAIRRCCQHYKGINDYFCLCRAFFVLFALKKDMEKDMQKNINSKR